MAAISMFPSFLAFAFSFSLLFCNLMPSYATETDIHCLKSFSRSVEDPFGYLKPSWNFSSKTQGSICKFIGVECWRADENKVMNLNLSDMRLRGKFPLGLSNCTSLTGLDLSRNKFSGPIPSDISTILGAATTVNLSSNEFSGEIPAGIGDISYLNTLKLDNNSLTGHIPAQLGSLSLLRSFSVANNLLSGKVPEFPMAFPASTYAGNQGLCGAHLRPCPDKPPPMDPYRKHSTHFIGGFAVGYVLCFLLSFVGFMFFCMPKKKRRKEKKMTRRKGKQVIDEEPGHFRINKSSTSNNTKILNLEKFVTRMSLIEIKRATNDFSHHSIISAGKTGTMHKATLLNVWFLAIKRLYHNQHFENHFANEAMILSTLRHPNLVPLIGFCLEANERLFVYTYMPNRNLHHWLHHPLDREEYSSKTMFLDWPSRLKIAIGVARGLTWLHNNPYFQVLHLDVTSKSILLDHNFRPKISSFGNAKLTNKGGATEMKDSGFVHKDVRDFGVILLEMITGKEASTGGESMPIDESLVGRGFDGEIYELLGIASSCLDPSSDQKPTMLQVFEAITSIGKSYDNSQTWVPSEGSIATARYGEIEEIGE